MARDDFVVDRALDLKAWHLSPAKAGLKSLEDMIPGLRDFVAYPGLNSVAAPTH
jgi:hypothetical protein